MIYRILLNCQYNFKCLLRSASVKKNQEFEKMYSDNGMILFRSYSTLGCVLCINILSIVQITER